MILMFWALAARASTSVEGDVTIDVARRICDAPDLSAGDDGLTVKWLGSPPGEPLTLTVAGQTASLSQDAISLAAVPEGAKLEVTQAGAAICSVDLVVRSVLVPERSVMDLVRAELERLKREDPTQLDRAGDDYVVVHGPDGRPMGQLPDFIREHETVRVLALLVQGTTAELDVVACGEVVETRVSGSLVESLGRFQGDQAPTFTLVELRHGMKCADSLTYAVKVTNGDQVSEAETTIDVHDLYRVSIGVGYGFDFGRHGSFSAGTRTADGAEEPYVDRDEAVGGPRALVALNLHLFRVDQQASRPTDWVPAVTLGLDPTNLDGGFVLGGSVFPYTGLGLTAGASVYQGVALDEDSGVSAGDPVPASGDLPTTSGWETPEVGLYLGVTVTGRLITDLLGGA